MEKKKLLIVIGLVTGVLAVLLIAVPPAFLSSDWGRKFTFTRLNRVMPGALSADDCTVSWWKAIECSNVVYADQEFQLDVTRLNIDRGLWQLLTKPEDLGTVILDTPLLAMASPVAKEVPVPAQPQPAQASDGMQQKNNNPAEEPSGGDAVAPAAETAVAKKRTSRVIYKKCRESY
ncbi:MAG: hypothetical protein D3923_19925 [Candidatus Electrothrix sp. AR3]|nr:hypothetical protein [Candidatus Electrothrix sp. AR3]